MTSALAVTIELRREAERAARADLERAMAARAAADEQEARLAEDWRAAQAAVLRAEGRRFSGPTRAVKAQTRERHRARLRAEATRAAQDAEQHRRGAQAAAHSAEDEARAAYEAARVALAVAEKLALRAAVKLARRKERQAEDVASDHAHAAHVRRRQGQR